MKLDVSDFVSRGWVANFCLYHAQAGSIFNPSQKIDWDEIVAKMHQTEKKLSFDSTLEYLNLLFFSILIFFQYTLCEIQWQSANNTYQAEEAQNGF